IYVTEPIAKPSDPAGNFATNGLVDVAFLDNDRFLALERSFSTGAGFTIRIFLADLRRATNVRNFHILSGHDVRPAKKTLLLDLDKLGITLDNIEGITFGPQLSTGERTLILIADNNFAASQVTQILAFAVNDGALD